MSEVYVMDHPLIQHKITHIRKTDVGTKEFREVVSEIAGLMCYEATRDLKLQDVKIRTDRKEAGGCADSSCGSWNGGRDLIPDSGCKGGTYRTLQRSGNA